MKAYLVKPGSSLWYFTEESVVEGKGCMEASFEELLFTDTVYDPVMMANGQALDPGLYAEGFSAKMDRAVRRGYYVFPSNDGSKGEYVAVSFRNLIIR